MAAGIAAFNASYINWVDDSVVTALLVSMGSPTWPTRDTWTSVPLGPSYGRCTAPDGSWVACDESHLLVGGVLGISPQKDNLTAYPDSTAYVVPRTRSVQLEYGNVHDMEALYNNGSCYLIGSASAASYWCTDTGPEQELFFGEPRTNNKRLSGWWANMALIRFRILSPGHPGQAGLLGGHKLEESPSDRFLSLCIQAIRHRELQPP